MVVWIAAPAAEYLERLCGGADSFLNQFHGRNGGGGRPIPLLRNEIQNARARPGLQMLKFFLPASGHLLALQWLNHIAFHKFQSFMRGGYDVG